jgi:hypothetical protein
MWIVSSITNKNGGVDRAPLDMFLFLFTFGLTIRLPGVMVRLMGNIAVFESHWCIYSDCYHKVNHSIEAITSNSFIPFN